VVEIDAKTLRKHYRDELDLGETKPMPTWQGFCSSMKLLRVCASYFGIMLGLAGLGSAWRGAERAWQLPKFIAGWLYVVAGVVWAALVVL
jgi:hypothetical protein